MVQNNRTTEELIAIQTKVAVMVMGWTEVRLHDFRAGGMQLRGTRADGVTFAVVPNYPEDLNAAQEIIARLGQQYRVVLRGDKTAYRWHCTFEKIGFVPSLHSYAAFAETAPLAICLAALELAHELV